MTEREALDTLDTLLNLLKGQKDGLSFNKILDLLKKQGLNFDGRLLKIALYRLVDDDYVYELVNRNEKDDVIYSITIQGAIFHGYAKQSVIDARNERRIKRNEVWLLRGTWFAGGIGLLVLFWYIFVWRFPHPTDFYTYWCK